VEDRSKLLADLLESGTQQSELSIVAKLVLKVRKAVCWVLKAGMINKYH
jgi:hypothetical protein